MSKSTPTRPKAVQPAERPTSEASHRERSEHLTSAQRVSPAERPTSEASHQAEGRPTSGASKSELLRRTPSGLYCEIGDFYIDPAQRVARALITHAHADHSRPGMQAYLSHSFNEGVMRQRLGKDISFQGVQYGEKLSINGVNVSFHPAGHIPGSAQIRVEHKGDVWVVSGDYKCNNDGLSTPFEPVTCRVFYTESTFALPVFNWVKQENVFAEIHQYWRECRDRGEHLILFAYSLGKAQRLLQHLDRSVASVYVHSSIIEMNEGLSQSGALVNASAQFWEYRPLKDLTETFRTDSGKTAETARSNAQKNLEPACIIAPASGITDALLKKLKHYRIANCSGWMNLRGRQRWDNIDRGFAISDHADWKELLWACKETGAEDIRPVHGYTDVLAKWLKENTAV